MVTNRVLVIAILVLVTFSASIHAQNSLSSVTGSVTPEGTVRMIAHGESLQIRMEIYSAAGDLVYDSGLHQGNLVDWKPADTAQPMADGSHLVVVTVKDFKGNLNQRLAALSSQAGQLQLQNFKRDQLTPAQSSALDSRRASQKTKMTEGDDAIAILREGKERSVVVTAGSTGCNLPAGSGVFNCTSSRATKENFMAVNGADVLSRLRGIEVSTWNYIAEGGKVRHIGPMAEDFFNAFQLGTGNTSIGLQDLTGVSLAAIKELHLRTDQLQQKTAEIEQLREQVNQLRQANSEIERRLATLEQLLLGQAQTPKQQ